MGADFFNTVARDICLSRSWFLGALFFQLICIAMILRSHRKNEPISLPIDFVRAPVTIVTGLISLFQKETKEDA